MTKLRRCKDCGNEHPETREYFDSMPRGGLRHKCRSCMNDYSRSARLNNPGRQERYNALRSQRGGHIRVDELLKGMLFRRQKGACLCCGLAIKNLADTEVDHSILIARGGTNDPSNLNLAHAKCNQEKHNKTLEEHWVWRRKNGLPVGAE